MPNNYTNILIVMPGNKNDSLYGESLVKAMDEWSSSCPLQRLIPMPTELEVTESPSPSGMPNWYEWQCDNWGVKWGVYGAKPAICLPGDCNAVMLSFITAWDTPKDSARKILREDIKKQTGASSVTWLGANPYDDSITTITE